MIRPLKCEFLSRNPTVVQFYDIIDPDGAQKLLEQTHGPGKFQRGGGLNDTDIDNVDNIKRVMDFQFDDDGVGKNGRSGTFDMDVFPKHFKILTHMRRDGGASPVGHSQLTIYGVGGEHKLHVDTVFNIVFTF